jgi:hypothetical protein
MFSALSGTVFGGYEDLATTEEAGIYGERTGPKKAERSRGAKADERSDAVEMRQHGGLEWHEQHEGVTDGDKRAANGGEKSDSQCDATHAQRRRGSSCQEVSVRRSDGEPGLHCRREADSRAQQQEAEACPAAWIVQNASAP